MNENVVSKEAYEAGSPALEIGTKNIQFITPKHEFFTGDLEISFLFSKKFLFQLAKGSLRSPP